MNHVQNKIPLKTQGDGLNGLNDTENKAGQIISGYPPSLALALDNVE